MLKSEILQGIEKGIKKSRFIRNNTLEIFYEDNTRAIRLYNTDIIIFLVNGDIQLNSGGYRTNTTKSRINENLKGFFIIQSNYNWYIVKSYSDTNRIPFNDNMVLSSRGKLKSKKVSINIKKQDRLKKQVSNYLKKIDTLKTLPIPNSGDCWHCSMTDENDKTWGDISENNDHLISHLKEKYIHGSLIVNALLESGYQDNQIAFAFHIGNRDNIKRAVRKYFYKRLLNT